MASKLSALLTFAVLVACASAQTMITNCVELQNMKNNLAGDYALANDIDCSDTVNWNGGQGFEPVGVFFSASFTGTLGGQGYQVSFLTINRPAQDCIGLFGYTSDAATISSLKLLESSLSGKQGVGSLVGENYGTLSNVYTTGTVTGLDGVGGLLGYNWGTLSNAYSSSTVTGSSYVGGLVGDNYGPLSNVYSTGAVTSTSDYDDNAGGLVGNALGAIANGYWDTETSGQSASDKGGGVIGRTTAQMHQQATFQGWDFDCVWAIAEGISYPELTFSDCSNRTVVVGTCTALQDAVALVGATVILEQDIDCADSVNWNAGAGFLPGAGFTISGLLSGNNHSISNLVINRPTTQGVGLFFSVGTLTQIGALGLEGGSVSGGGWVGSLVGNNSGTLSNAYSTGAVTGSSYVGGLVGDNYGTLSNAYSAGAVTGSDYVGGLVGYNWGTLSNAYSTGAVTGLGFAVGGLVGDNYGALSNAYSTGTVSASNGAGGLIGFNRGNLDNNYAVGCVRSQDSSGGLVGRDLDPEDVNQCYWDETTTGQFKAAGATSNFHLRKYGKPTGHLYQQATYKEWDFENTWAIVEGESYPYLKALFPAELPIAPTGKCPQTREPIWEWLNRLVIAMAILSVLIVTGICCRQRRRPVIAHKKRETASWLSLMAQRGNLVLVKLILTSHPHRCETDEVQKALILASQGGHLSVVVHLLEHAPEKIDETVRSRAARIAFARGYVNVAQALEASFSTAFTLTPYQQALYEASARGKWFAVWFKMRRQRAQENELNFAHPETGKTPLMISAENGHFNTAFLLLKQGADLLMTDLKGHTVIDSLIRHNQRVYAHQLVQASEHKRTWRLPLQLTLDALVPDNKAFTEVALSGQLLEDNNVIELVNKINAHPSVSSIDLSGNHLTSLIFLYWSEVVGIHPTLMSLNVSHNQVDKSGIAALKQTAGAQLNVLLEGNRALSPHQRDWQTFQVSPQTFLDRVQTPQAIRWSLWLQYYQVLSIAGFLFEVLDKLFDIVLIETLFDNSQSDLGAASIGFLGASYLVGLYGFRVAHGQWIPQQGVKSLWRIILIPLASPELVRLDWGVELIDDRFARLKTASFFVEDIPQFLIALLFLLRRGLNRTVIAKLLVSFVASLFFMWKLFYDLRTLRKYSFSKQAKAAIPLETLRKE